MIPNLNTPAAAGTQGVNTVRLMREGGRLLLDAAVLPARLPALAVGEEISARVAERLGNNQLVAVIKNSIFTLNIPQGMQVNGDALQLRVASVSPGLNFALVESGNAAAAEAGEGSVEVDISPASRYMTDLLQAGRSARGEPAEVRLDAGRQTPAQMADHLQGQVAKSGLFYESHVQAWADGRLPLQSLAEEPQAQLALAVGNDVHARAGLAEGRPVSAELGQLLQRQLDVLENRQVPLQGLAWPGQPMQMVIEQERADERQAHAGETEAQAWSTRLALELPGLGGLTARVRLSGQTVQISLVPDEAETGALIRGHADRLQNGLAASGLTLAGLTVEEHGRSPR